MFETDDATSLTDVSCLSRRWPLRYSTFAFFLFLCCLPTSAFADSFDKSVHPFLQKYCVDCHGPSDPEANLTLDEIAGDLSKSDHHKTWQKVFEKLELSQMPPEDADQPTDTERSLVLTWIRREAAHAGVEVESKLDRPGFGNYVKHELLFGDNDIPPSYSPPRIWRIRPAVYDDTIQNVAKGKYTDPFTLKSGGHGFRDYANQYQLAGPDLNQLLTNAKKAAGQLAELRIDDGKAQRGSRTPEQIFVLIKPDNKDPSAAEFDAAIDWLFHQVLLRDPTDDERRKLIDFTRKSMESDGQLLGVRNLIMAVLLSPDALYRSERGTGEPDEYGRIKLALRELAFAIAYALTDARPDQELLKAAENGELAAREQVRGQVERILNNAKIEKPRILGFFREYFEYGQAEDVFKDPELFRSHAASVLVRDTDHLVMHIYEQDKDVLRELLTTQESFVEYDLRNGKPVRGHGGRSGDGRSYLSYNLPLDWKWTPKQPITLPGKQRAGIVTQPAWLVAKSDNFDNHPIRRGLWIRNKLLGGTIPDLPITVDAQLPTDPTQTLRQRMQVTRETYCWQCHSKMNPLGLSFEMYDHFGRWRTKELAKPVLSEGSIDRSGDASLDGQVDNAVELVHRLADSERVRQVFVRHAFRYWMGRNETLADAATLRRADRAYVESGGSMKALITSLLTSDSFLYRKEIAAQFAVKN